MRSLIPEKRQWRNWSLPSKLTAIGVALGLISIFLSFIFWLLPRDTSKSDVSTIRGGFFDSLEYVEIRDSTLIAFDKQGKQWVKSFSSTIKHKLVADINTDGYKEILLGFSSSGGDHSKITALDSLGNEMWYFKKEPNYPYLGAHTGKFYVSDLKIVDTRDGLKIVALFNDHNWYQSSFVILDTDGHKLKELWHPGHLGQVIYFRDTFVIKGLNNDFRQTSLSKDPTKNFSVIFGVKYPSIYGEAPPYFGRLEDNKKLEWYYLLSDQNERLGPFELIKGELQIWAKCGKAFYLNEKGELLRVGFSDGYSCDANIKLVKII